jgi:hypothetical protein
MSEWVVSVSMGVSVCMYACFYELFLYIWLVYVFLDVCVWIYWCKNVFLCIYGLFMFLWMFMDGYLGVYMSGLCIFMACL